MSGAERGRALVAGVARGTESRPYAYNRAGRPGPAGHLTRTAEAPAGRLRRARPAPFPRHAHAPRPRARSQVAGHGVAPPPWDGPLVRGLAVAARAGREGAGAVAPRCPPVRGARRRR